MIKNTQEKAEKLYAQEQDTPTKVKLNSSEETLLPLTYH